MRYFYALVAPGGIVRRAPRRRVDTSGNAPQAKKALALVFHPADRAGKPLADGSLDIRRDIVYNEIKRTTLNDRRL